MAKKVYALRHDDPNVIMQGVIAIFSSVNRAKEYVEKRLNVRDLPWDDRPLEHRWIYIQRLDETEFFNALYMIEEYTVDEALHAQRTFARHKWRNGTL